jgi:serine/threonine protein kinase
VGERFGSYEIIEELGAGGIASVHLARSRAVKNPVALKRLHPHLVKIPELVGGFVDEARLARHLRHPGIARVYEFGRLRGIYFIAFEFVPGPTLQQLYAHCKEYVGRIPVPVVLEIAHQLADALDHAHNMKNEIGIPLGIVHRDVSPSNVIVSKDGQVMLIDFGLAKTKQSTVQSTAGVIKGKLNYVAPEYLDGGKLDARCDLWALGVVLYELLTGKRLFDAEDQGTTLDRVRSLQIPPPSRYNVECSSEVDRIILTLLERDPNRRWQRAAELRQAIERHLTQRITKQQLVQWVEWAFSQKEPLRREDSGISKLHDIMQSAPIEVLDMPAISEAMLARRRESVAQMTPLGQAMLQRRRAAKWIWVLVVMLLLVAALAIFALDRGVL